MNKHTFIIFGSLVTFLLCAITAKAATMSNDNFTVEKRTIDIKPYQKTTTMRTQSQEKPLKEGFNYLIDSSSPDAFSFGSSATILDYGQLSPTNPVIRKVSLLITSPYSFHIYAAADHVLQAQEDKMIPDTSCDNGSCSNVTAALWTNALTYGYGYRLDNMNSAYFKQTPDLSLNEQIEAIAQQISAQGQEIPLTYKVNISGTQEKGTYSNTLFYLATPDY